MVGFVPAFVGRSSAGACPPSLIVRGSGWYGTVRASTSPLLVPFLCPTFPAFFCLFSISRHCLSCFNLNHFVLAPTTFVLFFFFLFFLLVSFTNFFLLPPRALPLLYPPSLPLFHLAVVFFFASSLFLFTPKVFSAAPAGRQQRRARRGWLPDTGSGQTSH